MIAASKAEFYADPAWLDALNECTCMVSGSRMTLAAGHLPSSGVDEISSSPLGDGGLRFIWHIDATISREQITFRVHPVNLTMKRDWVELE